MSGSIVMKDMRDRERFRETCFGALWLAIASRPDKTWTVDAALLDGVPKDAMLTSTERDGKVIYEATGGQKASDQSP